MQDRSIEDLHEMVGKGFDALAMALKKISQESDASEKDKVKIRATLGFVKQARIEYHGLSSAPCSCKEEEAPAPVSKPAPKVEAPKAPAPKTEAPKAPAPAPAPKTEAPPEGKNDEAPAEEPPAETEEPKTEAPAGDDTDVF